MCKDTASWLSAKKMYMLLVENEERTAKYPMADFRRLREPGHPEKPVRAGGGSRESLSPSLRGGTRSARRGHWRKSAT